MALALLFLGPLPVLGSNDLSYIPIDHWSYQAFYRLSSLGLIPLDSIAARPITRLEAQRLVRLASAGLAGAGSRIAQLAQDDLRRLSAEFATDHAVTVDVRGATGSRAPAQFLPDRSPEALSISLQASLGEKFLLYGRAVGGGEPADAPRSELYGSFRLGSVFTQAGRTSVQWGPSLRSNLLLSANAGTFPLVRLATEIPRGRLTKVVAFLERTRGSPGPDVVLFATRLDWLPAPWFRLGLSETVITTWGAPLTFYHLIQPLPVFSAIVASYDLHDALGQPRNTAIGVDFDWLLRPGARLYGELMVDDAPGLRWPAKIGVLAGLYLLDPFRTGRTSLRLEYSLVTNGTYTYGENLEHAYLGRSLGHWLGPDGDDLYLELTHRLNPSTTFQLSFALTRHGQGRIGQPSPGPQDWFLSGVVERRHTVGFQLNTIHSQSLETRYRLELASVTNRGNVPGMPSTDILFGFDFAYRWPVTESPLALDRSAPPARPSPASSVSLAESGRFTLRTWSPTVTSRGALPGPAVSANSLGVGYRATLGTTVVSLAYDAAGATHTFWSADLRHAVARFAHGNVSIIAGWGGFQFRGDLGGVSRTMQSSGPRVGWDFYYQVAVDDSVTPLYLTGDIAYGFWSTRETAGWVPFYLWTYGLGLGWQVGSGISLEAGYRGAAAVWQAGTLNQTTLRWDGLYLSLAVR